MRCLGALVCFCLFTLYLIMWSSRVEADPCRGGGGTANSVGSQHSRPRRSLWTELVGHVSGLSLRVPVPVVRMTGPVRGKILSDVMRFQDDDLIHKSFNQDLVLENYVLPDFVARTKKLKEWLGEEKRDLKIKLDVINNEVTTVKKWLRRAHQLEDIIFSIIRTEYPSLDIGFLEEQMGNEKQAEEATRLIDKIIDALPLKKTIKISNDLKAAMMIRKQIKFQDRRLLRTIINYLPPMELRRINVELGRIRKSNNSWLYLWGF